MVSSSGRSRLWFHSRRCGNCQLTEAEQESFQRDVEWYRGQPLNNAAFEEYKKAMEYINDPIVEAVISQFRKRSQEGIIKYGTTMARTDIDFLGWLQHMKEELMDAVVYLERIQRDTIDAEIERKRSNAITAQRDY